MPTSARPVTATLRRRAGDAVHRPTASRRSATACVLGFSANTAIAEATSLYLRYEGNIAGPGQRARPHRRRAHDLVTGRAAGRRTIATNATSRDRRHPPPAPPEAQSAPSWNAAGTDRACETTSPALPTATGDAGDGRRRIAPLRRTLHAAARGSSPADRARAVRGRPRFARTAARGIRAAARWRTRRIRSGGFARARAADARRGLRPRRARRSSGGRCRRSRQPDAAALQMGKACLRASDPESPPAAARHRQGAPRRRGGRGGARRDARRPAEDAAEQVEVDIEDLAAIVDPEAALAAGSPLVHEELESNVMGVVPRGEGRSSGRAFAAAPACAPAPHRPAIAMPRVPMECRAGVAASHDVRTDSYTVWSSTQVVHWVRSEVAGRSGRAGGAHPGHRARCRRRLRREGARLSRGRADAVPARRLRVARALGGGPAASHLCAPAIRATSAMTPRSPSTARAASWRCGTTFMVDCGAWNPLGVAVVYNTAAHLPGPYRIAHFAARRAVAATNKVPNAPYRGAGRPEAGCRRWSASSIWSWQQAGARAGRGAAAEHDPRRRDAVRAGHSLP